MKVDNFHFFFLRSSVPVVSHHLGWAGRGGMGRGKTRRCGAGWSAAGLGGAGQGGMVLMFLLISSMSARARLSASILYSVAFGVAVG